MPCWCDRSQILLYLLYSSKPLLFPSRHVTLVIHEVCVCLFLCLSVSQSLCFRVCLSVFVFFLCISVCLNVCLSVCLSVCLRLSVLVCSYPIGSQIHDWFFVGDIGHPDGDVGRGRGVDAICHVNLQPRKQMI